MKRFAIPCLVFMRMFFSIFEKRTHHNSRNVFYFCETNPIFLSPAHLSILEAMQTSFLRIRLPEYLARAIRKAPRAGSDHQELTQGQFLIGSGPGRRAVEPEYIMPRAVDRFTTAERNGTDKQKHHAPNFHVAIAKSCFALPIE